MKTKNNHINFIKNLVEDIKKDEQKVDQVISSFNEEWDSWEMNQKAKWKPKKKKT